MQYIRCPIHTICMGMANVFRGGPLDRRTKGKRFALPHSRIMIHPSRSFGRRISGQARNRDRSQEIMDTKRRIERNHLQAHRTDVEKVTRDSERNFYLSAEEAKAYGIIDEVIVRKKMT